MEEDIRPLMVTIRCITYNQEIYIRQCLEGFVMQKTSFRFEAIVHDDASTDKTAMIIREYGRKYPDIIKPIYETENQYSKHDGSLGRIMDTHTHGQYVAVCEGDDYWTDPLKLQKQYDYMEQHPECSLCFHPNKELYRSKTKIHRPPKIKPFYEPEDVILGGGGFMATNSMFFRSEYVKYEGKPDFWRNAPVGDFPCMLFLVTKGKIGYIDDVMSVYRRSAISSWSSRQRTLRKQTEHHKRILKMLDEYDIYTDRKYHFFIMKKKMINIRNYFKGILKQLLWLY